MPLLARGKTFTAAATLGTGGASRQLSLGAGWAALARRRKSVITAVVARDSSAVAGDRREKSDHKAAVAGDRTATTVARDRLAAACHGKGVYGSCH